MGCPSPRGRGHEAVILPPMWAWAEVGTVDAAFWAACGFNALTFIPGEALACYGLGTLLLFALPKVPVLRPFMAERRLEGFSGKGGS